MLPKLVLRCSTLVLAALGCATPIVAQTFAALTGTDPVIGTAAPSAGRVAVAGSHRRAEEKLLYGRVRDGVYTVDGMVAKVQLNYDVNGVRFLYMFMPGVGTAVISPQADPETVMTTVSCNENELSFTVGEHRFDLTGVTLASDKGVAPAHLYVRLDRSAWRLNRRPMVGFGDALARPYVWPGALRSAPTVSAAAEETPMAPPMPPSLLPSASAVVPPSSGTAVAAPAMTPVSFR